MLTSIDAHECTPYSITSKPAIESFVERLCELIKMERFGAPAVVYFGREPKVAGYSLMQLIQTSSITGHFADDSRAAYIDIFSCAPYCPKAAAKFTADWFGAKSYKYHVVLRGTQGKLRR
jgi:S-adenosylmethionine/arginine decarboxylase-like enzyme